MPLIADDPFHNQNDNVKQLLGGANSFGNVRDQGGCIHCAQRREIDGYHVLTAETGLSRHDPNPVIYRTGTNFG
ncbi:MAG: hypothetical protein ABIU18_07620 [Novosphingobium sp.]